MNEFVPPKKKKGGASEILGIVSTLEITLESIADL